MDDRNSHNVNNANNLKRLIAAAETETYESPDSKTQAASDNSDILCLPECNINLVSLGTKGTDLTQSRNSSNISGSNQRGNWPTPRILQDNILEDALSKRIKSSKPSKLVRSPKKKLEIPDSIRTSIQHNHENPVSSTDLFSAVRNPGGALTSPHDERDLVFETIAHGGISNYQALPLVYDMRSFLVDPVKNQEDRSTCAAFVGATIKEIHNNRCDGSARQLSPEFIYHHRKTKPSAGMYGRDVFQILQNYGTTYEDEYTYCDGDNLSKTPSKKSYGHASDNKIKNYTRVETRQGLKIALYEFGPCYILLPICDRTSIHFWRGSRENAIGHAVTVVGYNESGFILCNSWGADWNGDGCCIFPYADWGAQLECWAPIDLRPQINNEKCLIS